MINVFKKIIPLSCFCLLLSGCFSSVFTGANLVYDRHHLYKKISDIDLFTRANRALLEDNQLKCHDCHLDLAVFKGDILVAGHVPTPQLQALAKRRIESVTDYRRLFFQVTHQSPAYNPTPDSWITLKIRSQIMADADIDPTPLKVITVDGVVYLMGEMIKEQALRVTAIASDTDGVVRVVTLMHTLEVKS